MPSPHIVNATDATFQAEVVDASTTVLVDFWATWCGPCKAIAPHLDKLADESVGKLKIDKVDVDKHKNHASHFGVTGIPTLLVFKNGELVTKKIGNPGGFAALQQLVAPYV